MSRRKRIGEKEILKAAEILQQYKAGKANLDARIIENEQWFKLRHWEQVRENDKNKPSSAWLFNSIINKHADAMDSYPEVVVLPREQSDAQDAEALTTVLNTVFDNANYEQVYSDKWWTKLKNGFSVEGVFWNSDLENGIGNIEIQNIDPLNLFWKPGIKKLEDSPNVFYLKLVDNDELKEAYPKSKDSLSKTPVIDSGQYIYDDTVDTSNMSVVVDWYYKKNINGVMTLQYCKFVNNVVLYASENTPERNDGFYAHGMYPFVIDILFPEEGTPAGFGYLDIMKDPQLYIDDMSGAILKNAKWNTKPRYLTRMDSEINEDEVNDEDKTFIHVEGSLDENAMKPMPKVDVPGAAFNILSMKIDELKETSGNRDVSQGGTGGGVSAASAIAALQEAGSKLTRDTNKASYRSFTQVAIRALELVRQFYDVTRCYRIIKPNGDIDFIKYDNSNISGKLQGDDFGIDLGARVPIFDLKIKAQKANAFSTLNQNNMAQQFFGMGFFNPEIADQALACLSMMSFEGKDELIKKISELSQTHDMMLQLQNKVMQLAAMLDAQTGGNQGAMIAGVGQGMSEGMQPQDNNGSFSGDPLGRAAQSFRTTQPDKARERAQNVGNPR